VDPIGLAQWKRIGDWLVRIETPLRGKGHAHVQGALRSNRHVKTQFDLEGNLREGANCPIPKDKILRDFLKSSGFRLGVALQTLGAIETIVTLKELANAPDGSIVTVNPLGGVSIIRPGDPDYLDLYLALGGS
jgi:hypothetical protein